MSPGWAPAPGLLGEFSEVLGGGGEVELISSAVRSTQSQSIQLEDALEVSEQHFDLFALAARGLVGLGFSDVTGEIARPFMD